MSIPNRNNYQDVLLEQNYFWHRNSEFGHFHQVVHFLFGPHVDDLARVLFRESVLETVVLSDVLVSGLELVESSLKDFDGHFRRDDNFLVLASFRVKYDGFFASADDAVDPVYDVVINQAEEEEPTSRIDGHSGSGLFMLVVETGSPLLLRIGEGL